MYNCHMYGVAWRLKLIGMRDSVIFQDVVTRYAHQNGFHVERRFGWDCHGLPVEYEIDKTLGIKVRLTLQHPSPTCTHSQAVCMTG